MKFWIYKDRAGYWRWFLIAANGKIIADSGEGYVNQGDCIRGIQLVRASARAPIGVKP